MDTEMRDNRLSIEEVDSLDRFLALRREWNGFLKEICQESIFLRHEWYELCWRRVEGRAKPWVWVVRGAHGIEAIAPLMIQSDRVRRLPVRKITFLENPDTPVSDFIAGASRRKGILAILEALGRHSNRWDLICLTKIPGESETIPVLQDLSRKKGFPFQSDPSGKRIYLLKTGDWDSYLRSKSPKFRKTFRNVQNRLEKAGKVTVEHHRCPQDLDHVLDELFAISKNSWKSGIGMAMSSSESIMGFFTGLSSLALQEGWLDIWLLKLDGKPVAMEYDLIDQGKVWSLRSDFDEAYGGYSPGTYLNSVIIKSLFDRGLEEYDMGPGSNQYKLRWGDQSHPVTTCILYNRTLCGKALFYLENRLIPMIKTARDRFQQFGNKAENLHACEG